MSSLKKTLMQKGMKLMSDPRVMKMMQDERVMKAVMAAMSVPGKAQNLAKEQLENVAKAMALATESEVKDLRRTVRKLEDELSKMKHADGSEKGPSSKGGTSGTSGTKKSSAAE
jgi:cell division FtsZ-interacting protein ZapD